MLPHRFSDMHPGVLPAATVGQGAIFDVRGIATNTDLYRLDLEFLGRQSRVLAAEKHFSPQPFGILALDALEASRLTVDAAKRRVFCEWRRRPSIAEQLKAGASHAARDLGGRSWLARAITVADVLGVKALVDAGADVDRLEPTGFRPIEGAVLHGQIEMVAVLLAAGAKVTPTALQMCAQAGRFDIYSTLKKRVTGPDDRGFCPVDAGTRGRRHAYRAICPESWTELGCEVGWPFHPSLRRGEQESCRPPSVR